MTILINEDSLNALRFFLLLFYSFMYFASILAMADIIITLLQKKKKVTFSKTGSPLYDYTEVPGVQLYSPLIQNDSFTLGMSASEDRPRYPTSTIKIDTDFCPSPQSLKSIVETVTEIS